MNSYKEDQEFFRMVVEISEINEKLGLENSSQAHLLLVDKEEQLEKRRIELNDQYMLCLIELDRIRIRETPIDREEIDILRKVGIAYGPLEIKKIKNFWRDYNQEILDFHQDNELINRVGFVQNYFKLIPPYVKVGTRIPEGIKNIYHESRWCFVYGQYSATIALCRTVVETVLKDKFDLEGDIKKIIETAKNRCLISSNTAWNANKVRTFANRILHEAKPAKEHEAKNAIDHVLAFLEEIYL